MAYVGGWPPRKGTEFSLAFPIFKDDGSLITGAAGLDSEISKDGGTFADCTNEASEIATASGVYKLTLTTTEMNANMVVIKTTSTTADAVTSINIVYTTVNQIDTIDGVVDAIQAKTDNLPTDPADQSDLEGEIRDAPHTG